METSELLKKVRKIEIKSRGLSRDIFAGQYHSAFKGRGMAFSEVREYQYGDDIRSIDWNVTARFNHPYVKVFEEERELTVMLLVDTSGSREFGSDTMMKKNLITEIAAVLSFSAIHNNDKIGLLFFSDRIEKFIPPQKGKKHILRIIRELIEFTPVSRLTNFSEPMKFITNAIKKRCTAFILSDFMVSASQQDPAAIQQLEDTLRITNKKHDLVAIRTYDKREAELPSAGLIHFADSETGEMVLADTSSRKLRENYDAWWRDQNQIISDMLMKSGIDNVQISTSEDYVKPLLKLFSRR
jgi:uncharacterized protein (DUF58 family)